MDHETASEMLMNFYFPEKEINMLWETHLLFLAIFFNIPFAFFFLNYIILLCLWTIYYLGYFHSRANIKQVSPKQMI